MKNAIYLAALLASLSLAACSTSGGLREHMTSSDSSSHSSEHSSSGTIPAGSSSPASSRPASSGGGGVLGGGSRPSSGSGSSSGGSSSGGAEIPQYHFNEPARNGQTYTSPNIPSPSFNDVTNPGYHGGFGNPCGGFGTC